MKHRPDIYKYSEIINEIQDNPPHHLLLGNGFSQECFKDIFSYSSLLDSADFSALSPNARISFDKLNTTNFETVIKTLNDSRKLHTIYGDASCNANCSMRDDAEKLKQLLVQTLAHKHPDQPSSISDKQYEKCRHFLEPFKTIYTVNYDLLLYWTIMQRRSDASAVRFKYDDGFRHPDYDDSTDYVTWEIDNTNKQSIHYLHGALHLFSSEAELKKYTWSRTGIPLIQQTVSALSNNLYPLIVSEGTSAQKMAQIMRHGYLLRGLKSLASIKGTLVVFGHSLNENDNHIFKRIEKNKISLLCIGLYGDELSPANLIIKQRAYKLIQSRPEKRPLRVIYFDSESAQVWG